MTTGRTASLAVGLRLRHDGEIHETDEHVTSPSPLGHQAAQERRIPWASRARLASKPPAALGTDVHWRFVGINGPVR